MAKKKKDVPIPGQQSLFDFIKESEAQKEVTPVPGSFNISNQLRAELSEGLRKSGLSRYEVAGRMSELMDTEITKSQLDSWTAESKEYHRFPAEYLPAFCAATGHKEPLRIMARLVQCHLLESEEALLAELGRIDQAKRDLLKQEKVVRDLIERYTGKEAG
ncbi:hypothetical protein [Pelotomaculum propionicicum]|uniref:Uncharacterized protein n=1 Tax=Pelotomaculum propionicicum TaxID=258475 RepID=A0A4Y7RP70_9FIRM|nr:hypothetical protein [Pelotomaculum propionicicum]TEB10653.1 hypothetical protein Pmgp_02233 [Pelotomaculum propionicicum]